MKDLQPGWQPGGGGSQRGSGSYKGFEEFRELRFRKSSLGFKAS